MPSVRGLLLVCCFYFLSTNNWIFKKISHLLVPENFLESDRDHFYCLWTVDSIQSDVSQPEVVPSSSFSATTTLDLGLLSAHKYLSKSLKSSTRSRYSRVYSVWREFCLDNGLPEFDAGYQALASCLSGDGSVQLLFSSVYVVRGYHQWTLCSSEAITYQSRMHCKTL